MIPPVLDMRFLNFHLFIAAASASASVSVTVCLSVRVNQKEFCSLFAGRCLPPDWIHIGVWSWNGFAKNGAS